MASRSRKKKEPSKKAVVRPIIWICAFVAWGALMLLLQKEISGPSKPAPDHKKPEGQKQINTVKLHQTTLPRNIEKPEKEKELNKEAPGPQSPPEYKETDEYGKGVEGPAVLTEPAKEKVRGMMSIIIDDMGRDVETAEKFLSLPYPLAFAVLPFEAHSAEVAEMIRKRGRTVLLHMPMEPRGYPKINPGPGALLLSQSEEEQYRLFKKALRAVPGARGVNNHMGSRFTEDREAMKRFMKWLKGEGLFFVDSRTTARTVACEVAREVGVPCLERNVFIDHEVTEKFIISQLDELARRASTQGYALAIGHPHEITYRLLKDDLVRYAGNGLRLVSLERVRE